jgi:hypothetical protein
MEKKFVRLRWILLKSGRNIEARDLKNICRNLFRTTDGKLNQIVIDEICLSFYLFLLIDSSLHEMLFVYGMNNKFSMGMCDRKGKFDNENLYILIELRITAKHILFKMNKKLVS